MSALQLIRDQLETLRAAAELIDAGDLESTPIERAHIAGAIDALEALAALVTSSHCT